MVDASLMEPFRTLLFIQCPFSTHSQYFSKNGKKGAILAAIFLKMAAANSLCQV